ncbi:hypothetical protein [Halobaculum sp. EA56]|uniref:hypothetical protein n=1 Tax=Halobaculum sp. EA56 TaxID=3421648 RepID=UPI003EBE2D59
MANINIKNGRLAVEGGQNQLVGNAFDVTVPVNNRETFGWGNGPLAAPNACMYQGPNGDRVPGHEATVEVQILRGGTVVDSGERTTCAPVEGGGVPDPQETFSFTLDEPGAYDVRATVSPHGPEGGAPSDTVTRTIHVEETGNAPPADDGGNEDGGLFGGGSGTDGSNPFATGGSNPLGLPNTDIVLALIALALVAWLASSASNTAEAVT